MAIFSPVLGAAAASNGDDILVGSAGEEVISGLNGADVIYGLGDDDVLNGNAQDDTLLGGTGSDELDGGTGDDALDGNDGDDTLIGGTNDDWLSGGGEDDTLIGNTGFDHLSGGGEDDNFLWTNGDGNDVDDGGSGQDILNIFGSETEGDIFSLDPTDAGTALVFQRENLVPFNIQISNIEAVEVFGGGGDDFFETGDLAVTGVTELFFDGGDGSDTVSTQANEGAGIVAFGGAGADFFFGGNGAEDFFGEDGADHFFSGAGDDFLEGDAGNDQMFGGSGDDIADGGEGNDVIVFGPGDDVAITGTGQDQIRYDLSPVAGGHDVIDDFQNFADDLFLGGITKAEVDSNGDDLVNDADDLASYDVVTDTLTLSFNTTDSLSLIGIDTLSVSNDLIFV